MKFWPLSLIAESPLVPPGYAHELQNFNYRMPSHDAYLVAMDVARHTKAVQAPNMAIINTIGGATRRVYTDYPEPAEWSELERSIIIDDNDFVFILMDALH